MSKSKYPNKIDTSVEIPYVRNNILQMGSEAINSLRSAVINIERTLGINPQGGASQTLANRLDRALDDSGNIKPDAISKIGLLTGPITDRDVSNNASIKESKIKLDYPTSLLYSEISGIFGEIKSILSQLMEINKELSSHISEGAINRHLAKAISLEEIFRQASDTSTNSLSEQNLQDAISAIITGHINFSGSNISSTNNSHSASQIYFDNQNTEFSSNNMQSVLEEINLFTDTSVKDHQDVLHGNVLLDYDYGSIGLNNFNSEIIYSNPATALRYGLNSDSQFSSFNIQSPIVGLDKSDYISAEINGLESKYQINKVESDGFTTSVEVFGNLSSDFEDNITIIKEEKDYLSDISMKVAFINNPNTTSKNIAEVISPNSSYVISSGLNYSKVSANSSNISISINSVKYDISCYLPTVDSQTPDSIVEAINERSSELNGMFAATAIYSNGRREIAIYSRVPNTLEKTHSIKIERGSDDGIDNLGFSDVEGVSIKGSFSSSYIINGNKFSSFSEKLKTSNLTINPNSNIISSSNQDLTLLGIKVNDIIHIYNSSSNSGSYIIKKITQNQITVETINNFNQESGTPIFVILKNTISLSSENFKKVSGSYKSLIGDVFIDRNNETFIDSVFEYSNHIVSNKSICKILDFSGYKETFSLYIDKINNETIQIYIDNIKVNLSNVKNYSLRVESSEENLYLDIFIEDSSSIINYIDLIGSNISLNCQMSKSISDISNLKVSRINYNNFNGRFSGGDSLYSRDLFERGAISKDNISSKYKEENIEEVINDLRSSGISKGCKLESVSLNPDGTFSVKVSSGICYILGKKISIKSIELSPNLNLNSNDKIYIYINKFGVLMAEPALYSGTGCYFSKNNYENIVIGSIEYDGITAEVYDLRIKISDIDRKIIGPIIVSKDKRFGHFQEIGEAIKAAKRFYEIYRDVDSVDIQIKSGHYKVNIDTQLEFPSSLIPQFDASSIDRTLITSLAKNGLWIDFPVKISGDRDSTKIEIIFDYSNIEGWQNSNQADRMIAKKGFLAIGGTNLSEFPSYPSASSIKSGKIIFEDLSFLNTSVVLYDTDVVLDDNNSISSGFVKFSNCNFENSIIDPSRYRYRSAIIYNRQQLSSPRKYIGGLEINSCYFKYSNILFTSPSNSQYYSEDDRFFGLDIINNKIESPASDSMLETKGILSKFESKTSIYGPNIFGNIYLGSRGKTTSQSSRWVSSIPTGLNIHGDIKVGNISNESSGNSNSIVSEFYTNVEIKSGYDLIVGGSLRVSGFTDIFGNLDVAGKISGNEIVSRGDLTVSGDTNIQNLNADEINAKKITLEDSLDTETLITNDATIGNLNVTGEIKGIYTVSHLGRVSVPTEDGTTPDEDWIASVRWISSDTENRWGYNGWSAALNSAKSYELITVPETSRIRSMTIKSLESGLRNQKLKIYVLPNNKDYNQYTNYNLIYESNTQFSIDPYGTKMFSGDDLGGFSILSNRSILVMFENLTPGDTFTVNLVMEYNVPISLIIPPPTLGFL